MKEGKGGRKKVGTTSNKKLAGAREVWVRGVN